MESVMGSCRKPEITFSRSGKIDITAGVARALSLEDGDVIDVIHERTDRGEDEWYLSVRLRRPQVGSYVNVAHRANRTGRFMRVQSKQLTDSVMSQFPEEMEKLKLCVGKPVLLDGYGTCLPLILRKLPLR